MIALHLPRGSTTADPRAHRPSNDLESLRLCFRFERRNAAFFLSDFAVLKAVRENFVVLGETLDLENVVDVDLDPKTLDLEKRLGPGGPQAP